MPYRSVAPHWGWFIRIAHISGGLDFGRGNSDNGNRSDYARLWNWRTDEVLRIRPGVFGSEAFKKIHALPDGTIVVNTHQHTDDILSLPEDFWHFLRTASRPNKLGYWLNYPKPYPEIDLYYLLFQKI